MQSEEIIHLIEEAFEGVSLAGGISLQEAVVIDRYGTREERRQARARDEQNDWREIPDDMIARYSASLAFLDRKGMRFYLPAFMRFSLKHYQNCDSASIDFTIYQLDLAPGSNAEDVDLVFEKAPEEHKAKLGGAAGAAKIKAQFEGLNRYRAERLTLLTEPQREAARAFLQFMAFETCGQVDERVAKRALASFFST